MKSIKELYRIGTGPSSSHTMGPRKAAEQFLARHPEATSFQVTLYGSLAATGKGHMTDVAILDVLQPHAPVEILWKPHIFFLIHHTHISHFLSVPICNPHLFAYVFCLHPYDIRSRPGNHLKKVANFQFYHL